MDIIHDIFLKSSVSFEKLNAYGFVKKKDDYCFSKNILNNAFRVDVIINLKGEIDAKIFDLTFNEEYVNYKSENQTGSFVNKVREAFTSLLIDIRNQCTVLNQFASPQANRLALAIHQEFQDDPQFIFDDDQTSGIFRNPTSDKWYGIIMHIKRSKLEPKEGMVDVLNVKLDENLIQKLLTQKGFYKAYHMNKKSWISIVLDETLSDHEILNYITQSRALTEKNNEWIIPANPKYFDVIQYFNQAAQLQWKQPKNMHLHDKVYIYLGSPYSCILYQCEVIAINLPYVYQDKNLSMNTVMRLKLLKKYEKNQFTFEKLNEYGIHAVRGPRTIPSQLSKILNQ